MDNQMFPGGGAFLDDVAQVCPLCGIRFNNTFTYQHHMQLHILSANAQMIGNQPPPDPGIGIPTPTSILDLMGGVSHALSSGSGVPLVSPQAIFSGSTASMPPHLISPGIGLMSGSIPSMGLAPQQMPRVKEKKQKPLSLKPSSSSGNTNTTPSSQRASVSGAFKSRDNSSSTYISTFPKDLQKIEQISHQKQQIAPHTQANVSTDVFLSTAQQLDPLEALISPVKMGLSGFDRQLSRKSTASPPDSGGMINKESKKLFQPFVSVDSIVTAGFVTKSNTHFTTASLMSPIKSGSSKPPLMDVLSTPQKISYHSNSENLFTSPPTLPSTSGGDIRHFGMFQDSEVASVPIERKSALPSKMSSLDDKVLSKAHFFPDVMDPLNISPKAGQSVRKKDIESLIKMPVHQGSLDHSRSSSPVPRQSLPNEFASFRADPGRAMVSPKVSPAIASSLLDTDSTSLSAKPHMFGGAATEVLPTASVPTSTAAAFGGSVTSNASTLPLTSPGIDIAVNPLGTGYFNALTQKFIDPTFSLGSDFNKPGTTGNSSDDQKQKIYLENGVIMNQDYDKISDTNDEDNLEQLIDDIDSKSDTNDKGYSEIEDLLNEFNEKQEDMKNKTHLDDFIKNDDFLKNVMEDPSKGKVETSVKVDEAAFNPPEEFEMNKSIITDILEQEKERIEKESTELENARLSSLINTSTATSTTSVTTLSSTATSTVTSVSNTEPKVSTSTDHEGKKEDDHVDFEIPKVGKLMKIRKYFQIQEQKRKEQTEKVTEIRVHEKTETPVEDKPQTILVQVSKRKKLEYGPYLNRQSLLEGKPKTNIETTSPPKASRPKPKPPAPEKRTFNLRERKTKTDFATLASTGSRTAEAKKPDTKQKAGESIDKNKIDTEVTDEVKEDISEDKTEETEPKDAKIVTRNQEKKKEVDPPVDKPKSKANKGGNKSCDETEKEKSNENETKQKDLKAALRTRSAKNETENAEGKNLRKRNIKSPAAADGSASKVKIKKTDESVQKVSSENVQKANTESEEKITRSKSKIKTTPEKSGIKKCSVNLGEKYNEMKAKSLVDKVDNKETATTIVLNKGSTEELVSKMEVEHEEKKSSRTEVNENECKEKDQPAELVVKEIEKSNLKEKDRSNLKVSEVSKAAGNIGENQANENEEKPMDISESQSTEEIVCTRSAKNETESTEGKNSKNENKIDSEPKLHKSSRKGNKSKHDKGNRKESNIFDQIDQPDYVDRKHSANKTDESQMVSITSTDNTDKKVTMKLKLGPNFQKAFELFNPKKRKHETVSESKQSSEKETKKDQKIEKETKTDQRIEKKLKVSDEVDKLKDTEPEISNENVTDLKVNENDSLLIQKTAVPQTDLNVIDNSNLETDEHVSEEKSINSNDASSFENMKVTQQESEKEYQQVIAMDIIDEERKEEKTEKKVKHSVENEFQRLVNEAMAEAQKEGETAKSKNLRRRMNENVKYNVDESDDELDKIKLLHEQLIVSAKGQKTPKGSKVQGKGVVAKGKPKLEISGIKDSDKDKLQQSKKDVDVYDFTDTEMSDTEESTPKKLGFKPKYVSNLNLFGQKKLPFVSKPFSPEESLKSDDQTENGAENILGTAQTLEGESENVDSEISYVGKTVEPLKIKLTKIIPFKEKKHKHKKKKRKKEKERKEGFDKFDSESKDSIESDGIVKADEGFVQQFDEVFESENNEMRKAEEVKSVESVGQESNSNEGDDESTESGTTGKSNKRTKLKEKKHICEYCNVGFGQKCDLRRHIMIHTGERPYPCQICDKRFQRKTDLAKHTRTHTGEKPYACEFCDKRVSDKSQLNVHRRLHTGDRPYCCSKCGKRCITSSELSRHKAVHCGEKVERCNLCKKAFSIKECLGMHMKLHYRSRGKSYRCEKCAIGFDKKNDLDNHHCVDPMKNVYVCSECYEEFSDEMLYAEHIKTHDLGVLACNVCTNIFEDKHSLETHLCNLGVEKQKQLTCEICETEFQDLDSLNRHVTVHDNDEGSFMCDLCSEMFKVRKHYIEHCKIHDQMTGFSSGNSPRTFAGSLTPSHLLFYNKEIISQKESDKLTLIKEEVDTNNFQILNVNNENVLNTKENASSVKTEDRSLIQRLAGNRPRASVISGTFRIDDDSGDFRHPNFQDRVNFQRSMSSAEDFVNLPDQVPLRRTSSETRTPDFIESGRFFESADFTNSPDFSTLTESDDLDLSPFENVSNSLKNDSVNKSVKINQNLSAKQIDSSASIDLKEKIMKRFGTNSQPYGTIPVSNTRVSTTQGSLRQASARNLPLQNSQISAMLSSDTTATRSSDSSQSNNHSGHLQRSLSADHNSSQFQNSQNNLSQGAGFQQNSQNKRWSGFQGSEPDFSGSFNNKSDHFPHSLSKSTGNMANLSSNRSVTSFNKDDIENQMKSEFFADFDVTPGKNVLPNKFGNSSANPFPGINPNSFSSRQFLQNFPEKSEFTSFGQSYQSAFPQTSTYNSNLSSSSLKSGIMPDGAYSLDSNVTPDVNKRHLQGIYNARSDIVQDNTFYLSGIDDPMKDLAGSDKDETAALLSNFDQF